MTRDDIRRMSQETGICRLIRPQRHEDMLDMLENFAALVTAAKREDVLNTIDALYDGEQGRHPMFSEGYNHALLHIEEFVKGRT